MQTYAKVIADSISPTGSRLITFECQFPRFILPQFNTHRGFSRNSGSSRAIPTTKLIQQVRDNPVIPFRWGANKPGMQAGADLPDPGLLEGTWRMAADNAAEIAERYVEWGLHKETVNRLLEPFVYHKIIFSSTMPALENFFEQRISPLAQPEINALAVEIHHAMCASLPSLIGYGEWHLPYVTTDDPVELTRGDARKVSAARCARVSYLTHDGKRDISKDLELYDKLVSAGPPHWSPLEHVATPSSDRTLGNFDGWEQFRHLPECQ